MSDDPAMPSRRAALLARVLRFDGVGIDLAATLHQICCVTVDDHGADGAAITMMTPTEARLGQAVAGVSDAASRAWEELQLTLGEGPGVDAFTSGRPVLVPDLAAELGRWPGFTSEALAAGVAALHAFPVQLGGIRYGVLTTYGRRPRELAPDAQACLLELADIATVVLLDTVEEGTVDSVAPRLLDAMDVHTEVYQAQGMVMVQLDVDLAEALARMRAHAFATGTALPDLARSIVAGETRLSDEEGR